MEDLDYEEVADAAASFIRRQVGAAGADGVVFGLSGGIDSSVVAYLSARGVGAGRCLALLMPSDGITPASETDDGRAVAELLGIEHKVIPIGGIVAAAAAAAAAGGRDAASGFAGGEEGMKRTVGNLNARVRASVLYYEGQKRNRLVVGTDDRSEYLIGYFTKYGDGASDMLPIADLYKTQVQRLGLHLGVPRRIVEKAPSPHLWRGHDASAELGMGYDMIDRILEAMTGKGADGETPAPPPGATEDMVRRVGALHSASGHKRRLPPMPRLRGAGKPEGKSDAEGEPAPLSNPARRSTERRPWGRFERFTLNQTTTVKIIDVDPGAALSLQRHSRRSEYWFLIEGSATAVLGDEEAALEPGGDCFIPAGTVHRLAAGGQGARLLEIAFGDFSEDDIVRLRDAWGRK